jgi:formylglycine-generating enzyme required for sulfatase activity
MKRVILMLFWMASTSAVLANGLVVSGVTRTGASRDRVQFTVSWQNSWYVSGAPFNHDAVWLFVKYRECNAPVPQYNHALLSTTMGDHTLSAGLAFATPIVTTDRYGNAGQNNTGAMVRRATLGQGNINNQTVTLRLVGGIDHTGAVVGALDPALEYEIEAYGIEMVFIPQGQFEFSGNNGASNWLEHVVTAETGFRLYRPGYAGSLSAYNELSVDFPKGFQSFYIMKYEISQGQYVKFLNNIGNLYSNRYAAANFNQYRYGIQMVGAAFVSTEPNRACNYISLQDLLAYLDWSALRPMTELEYEKACKGASGAAVTPIGAYPWGTNTYTPMNRISLASENGSELVSDPAGNTANCHVYINWSWPCYHGNVTSAAGGCSDLGNGPVGVGIFARDGNESRISSGATYYGVMEMGGNVWESTVSATNDYWGPSTRSYNAQWGNGILNGATGQANVTGWPDQNNNNFYVHRGGSFGDWPASMRISDRNNNNMASTTVRYSTAGGRGVR